jgi:hypothetical protein
MTLRSKARTTAAAAALLVLAGAAAAAAAAAEENPPEGAEIRNLEVENSQHDLLVSFDLTGAFSPEVEDQIESGLPVTFNHYVEVLNRRAAWFDDTLVRKVVSTSVAYDTLTRQYRLTRAVDGETVETAVSEMRPEMERFMTRVERLRMCDPADLPGEKALHLRVKSRVRKRFVFFFIPWDFETSWARVRLSLPRPGEGPAR